jgi:hypothetical protein
MNNIDDVDQLDQAEPARVHYEGVVAIALIIALISGFAGYELRAATHKMMVVLDTDSNWMTCTNYTLGSHEHSK